MIEDSQQNSAAWVLILTDSNNDDVTRASVNLPVLMFARTGAPKPIEESCRLGRLNT